MGGIREEEEVFMTWEEEGKRLHGSREEEERGHPDTEECRKRLIAWCVEMEREFPSSH